jgi:hypothetical protein
MTGRAKGWAVIVWLTALTLALSAQLFINIDRNAVNMLFMDQWDTYQPLFKGYNILRLFIAQEGQLRLGVGGWVCKAVAASTGWNTRAEAFTIGLIIVLTAVAAVFLKYRLFKSLTLWDSLIPLTCLSATLSEVPTIVPFPSHGVVPLFLILVYACCLTLKNVRRKLLALTIVNLLLVYTGWGLFVGFLTPPLLGFLIIRHADGWDRKTKMFGVSALIISIGSLISYFVGYLWHTGASCFNLLHHPLLDYFLFLDNMFFSSFGDPCGRFRYQRRILGALLVILLLTVLLTRIIRLYRNQTSYTNDLIIAFFICFSFLFALNATVGRVCLGICAAGAGRYQPLLIPAWLGLYFVLLTLSMPRLRTAALFLLTLSFINPELRRTRLEAGAVYYSKMKSQWRKCYLDKGDAEACNRELKFVIYPTSREVQDRLDYLKERKLNLFSDQKIQP